MSAHPAKHPCDIAFQVGGKTVAETVGGQWMPLRVERTSILPAQSWSSTEEWRRANDAAWAARSLQMSALKLHWLLCHRQAVRDGFHHYAAGIRAMWVWMFGEPFPVEELP